MGRIIEVVAIWKWSLGEVPLYITTLCLLLFLKKMVEEEEEEEE